MRLRSAALILNVMLWFDGDAQRRAGPDCSELPKCSSARRSARDIAVTFLMGAALPLVAPTDVSPVPRRRRNVGLSGLSRIGGKRRQGP
jgi:hypothetical protein